MVPEPLPVAHGVNAVPGDTTPMWRFVKGYSHLTRIILIGAIVCAGGFFLAAGDRAAGIALVAAGLFFGFLYTANRRRGTGAP